MAKGSKSVAPKGAITKATPRAAAPKSVAPKAPSPTYKKGGMTGRRGC